MTGGSEELESKIVRVAEKIIVTGANGAIGSVFVPELRRLKGTDLVIAGYNRTPLTGAVAEGPSAHADVTNLDILKKVVELHGINIMYNFSALLSVATEENPELAYKVNVGGLKNTLAVAAEHGLRLFWLSSMAVFGGKGLQKENTPQDEPLQPDFEYGKNKKEGEELVEAYFNRGVDVRSVRFPGMLGPGPYGPGTTEVINEMIDMAAQGKPYVSPLRTDTVLPMMDTRDGNRAILALMDAPREDITVHSSYNLAGYSVSIREVASNLRNRFPGFKVSYRINPTKQAIADSWPDSIDASIAFKDFGFEAEYDLDDNIDYVLEHRTDSVAV